MSPLNNIGVVTALENLMKAVAQFEDADGVSKALQDAVDILGYDPNHPEQNYDVSLHIDFEATSPEEAVKQFIEMLTSDRSDWVYTVIDEDGVETMVDTYRWGPVSYQPKSLVRE